MHRTSHSGPAMTLAVGGVRLRFESADPGLTMQTAFPRTRFLVDEVEAVDCLVRVRCAPVAIGNDPLVFGPGGPWELRRGPDGGDSVSFWTQLDDTHREPMMRLDLTPELERGDLVIEPRYARDGLLRIGYPLDEYLMARLLARRGAVVLHASAIAEDGGAFVFAGHSGAGKSTISEIAEQSGAELLSDDRTVLSVRDGVVLASGTPWHGSLASGSPSAVPVRAIFLLEQASADAVVPIAEPQAFSELLVRLVRPTVELVEQLSAVDTLQAIVRRVPTATLRFLPRSEALDAVRRYMELEPDAPVHGETSASLTL